MINVNIEKNKEKGTTLNDIWEGDVFVQKDFPNEVLLMTSSRKDNDRIAVVLETGESLFLNPKTKGLKVFNEARLYVKD